MSDDLSDVERLDRLERTLASVTTEHTGQLLALQSIAAVLLVREMAGTRDPKGFLDEARKWAQSVISTTNAAPSLDSTAADAMRDTARRTIDRFFDGIVVSRKEG